MRISHGSDHRRGDQRADALDLSQPTTDLRGGKDSLDPALDLTECLIQCYQFPIEVLQELAPQSGQVLSGIV